MAKPSDHRDSVGSGSRAVAGFRKNVTLNYGRYSMLRISIALLLSLAMVGSFAHAVDRDGDGLDDLTGKVSGISTPGAGVSPATVVHQIPVPAGCQSIVWVCTGQQSQGTLFVSSTWDLTIYELDPVTGAVLNSFPAADPSGCHGLAWDGRYLIQNGYNTFTTYFTDKDTGAVVYTQPSSGGYGLTWGKWDGPYDDQWLWAADHTLVALFQDDYYTGANVNTFATAGANPVGAAWDGLAIWDSNWSDSTLHRYDANTGALLDTMAAPYTNPRDLCWDGHYLWTIHWENQTAYKIDIWLGGSLYPLTQYLNPRYVKVQRGGSFRLNVTLKNHSTAPFTTQVWLDAQQRGSTSVFTVAGPVGLTLPPMGMIDTDRTMTVPAAAPTGIWDLYLRCNGYPQWSHQDGIVVEITP